MPFQTKVKYGAGYRVLKCTILDDSIRPTGGEDISFLIEGPDATIVAISVHLKHVPNQEFYDQAEHWLQVELNAKRLTLETIPATWDADLMNRIED